MQCKTGQPSLRDIKNYIQHLCKACSITFTWCVYDLISGSGVFGHVWDDKNIYYEGKVRTSPSLFVMTEAGILSQNMIFSETCFHLPKPNQIVCKKRPLRHPLCPTLPLTSPKKWVQEKLTYELYSVCHPSGDFYLSIFFIYIYMYLGHLWIEVLVVD